MPITPFTLRDYDDVWQISCKLALVTVSLKSNRGTSLFTTLGIASASGVPLGSRKQVRSLSCSIHRLNFRHISERERETERETETETETETERQTETETETERQTDRQRQRQTDRQTQRERERQRQRDRETETETDRQTQTE